MGEILQKNGGQLHNVFERWRVEWGRRYAVCMGGARLFLIFDSLDDVHEILVKKFYAFVDRQVNRRSKSLARARSLQFVQ